MHRPRPNVIKWAATMLALACSAKVAADCVPTDAPPSHASHPGYAPAPEAVTPPFTGRSLRARGGFPPPKHDGDVVALERAEAKRARKRARNLARLAYV